MKKEVQYLSSLFQLYELKVNFVLYVVSKGNFKRSEVLKKMNKRWKRGKVTRKEYGQYVTSYRETAGMAKDQMN